MTYKQMIKNIVNREVESWCDEHNAHILVSDGDIEVTTDKSDIDFTVEVKVNYVKYLITGYMSEWGYVRIIGVRKDNDILSLVYGDALDTFSFI